MIEVHKQRFESLSKQLFDLEATKSLVDQGSGYREVDIDDNNLLTWSVKARHLLSIACGSDSEHLKTFVVHEEPRAYETAYYRMKKLRAVFLAAREDYEHGLFVPLRNLVRAEVFDNELEQASELIAAGYLSAAAVIAGVVLETTIKQMCDAFKLAPGKLDRMNADLAKAGAYNALIAKQITAHAAIRNSAAHGKADEFNRDAVVQMIAFVESVVGDRLR